MALQMNASITAKAEAISQSKKIIQVVEDACRMVPELVILEEEPVEVRIHKLAIGVHETWIEMAWACCHRSSHDSGERSSRLHTIV